MIAMSNQKARPRPNLSIFALISFIASFIIARTFTVLFPNTSLISRGYHIHHFWFGLAMLIIGGWLGISYRDERSDRFASIVFGAGSGLVGDEIGLLLTLGDYWTEITYTFMILVSSIAATVILFMRYSKAIHAEFDRFLVRDLGFYSGIFLAAISAAFFFEAYNIITIVILIVLSAIGLFIVLAHWILVHRSPKSARNRAG